MGSREAPAYHDLVGFSDLLLNAELGIGKGRSKTLHELSEHPRSADDLEHRWILDGKGRGSKFLYQVEASVTLNLDETPCDALVLLKGIPAFLWQRTTGGAGAELRNTQALHDDRDLGKSAHFRLPNLVTRPRPNSVS